MSEDAVDKDQEAEVKAEASEEGGEDEPPIKRIYLVPYPKIIFFYPTYFVGLIIAIYLSVRSRWDVTMADTDVVVLSCAFLFILGINLVVLAFDFPRATSLTMFFLFCAMLLGAVLFFTQWPEMLPTVTAWLKLVRPVANATFYWMLTAVLTVIYIIVFISVRFDYWEVRPNELLHHHGILSDLKRFSAPNLRIDKEINDIFEYVLLKSGRLILQPSSERRAIILDNVLFISKKEEAITRMLGALQVQVRDK